MTGVLSEVATAREELGRVRPRPDQACSSSTLRSSSTPEKAVQLPARSAPSATIRPSIRPSRSG